MGAYATGPPLFPAGYVAGKITISAGNAGTPLPLLSLIQAQLDSNCPGAGQEVTIQADTSGAVYVGRASTLGGALSTSNYGYVLDPGTSTVAGASRTYRSSFPGNNSPVGDLQVLMAAAGTFHVEVA